MSKIFALTGSIAVGKSTVSKIMEKYGVIVIDADLITRDIVVVGSTGLARIQNHFGSEVICSDGTLDRAKLGAIVFHNQEQLNVLNSITHPLIRERAEFLIASALENGNGRAVCYDSALIIESGQADKYRPLVVVSCDKENQLRRLMKRNNLSEVDAHARISKQLSSEEKIKHANFVIETNETIEKLEDKVINTLISIAQFNN